jgi:glycosyltransferase involved in cell wall biosynthesis
MRLLHLVHSWPPDSRGGVEVHVEGLARAQLSRGDTVRVATGSEALREVGGAAATDDDGGLIVERFVAETDLERAAGSGAGRAAFRALLERDPPDLVHVHHFAATGPGVVSDALELGAAVVVSLHDLHTVCPLFFRLRGERELCAAEVAPATCVDCLADASGAPREHIAAAFDARSASFAADLRAAHAVLAQSRAQLDYLARVPLLEGVRLTTIGQPSPPEPEAGPLPPELPDLPLRVATWGGLVRGKGMRVLLDAALALPPESVELHHHGKIVDEAFRDELIASAGWVPLTFHGPYEPGELRSRLRRCDLAVHPSLFLETHGLVTDEALRLGLPVVVPDRGAPAERIGMRGRTFHAGDAADLAHVLTEFVERPERLLAMRAGKPGPLLELDEFLGALDRIYSAALERRR